MFVSLLASCAWAQDSHLRLDPARALYQRSAFAHGYIHGYEMGFHTGDFDFQMSRSPREIKKVKEFKSAKQFYATEYGNRDQFSRGYEEGFRVGYADAYSGRTYRAAKESRTLADSLSQWSSGDQRPDGNFDEGFSNGYRKGMSTGLEQARSGGEFMPATDSCEANDKVKSDTANPFCKAFKLGYQLGYSDGYNNQRAPDTTLRTAQGDK